MSKALLKTARARFKMAEEAWSRQREREKADLKFQDPDLQWTEEAKRLRLGDQQNTLGRPILSVPKINQPLQLVMSQASSARLGIDVVPVSEKATKANAEVKQGIIRRIERDSNATVARLWAFDRAIKCGFGCYEIGTQYDDDATEYGDQEIVIRRIKRQDQVLFDPSATKADLSDGEFVFRTAWYSFDAFRREFPGVKDIPQGNEEWRAAFQEDPNWIKLTPGKEEILVAEYWYKEHEFQRVGKGKKQREIDIVTVHVVKFAGPLTAEKDREWPGKYIPYVPVLGNELQPFDEEIRYQGMIRPARDGQRLYNYGASTLAERMSTEPKAPWLIAEGQDRGYEDEWAQVNVRNLSVLRYRQTDAQDNPAPPPQRVEVGTQGMSIAIATMEQSENFIESTMKTFDPSIGRPSSRERSGKAIQSLQRQSEASNSGFLTDLARISMNYEGRILLDLLPHIYDAPGRVVQILGEEEEPKLVMIGRPYRTDPASGRPHAIKQEEAEEPDVKYHNLKEGRYSVAVTVGRSYQTRMQEGQEELGRLLQAQSELWPIAGPLFLRMLDMPGAKELADMLKRYREFKFPMLRDPEEPMSAEAAMARAFQLEQQNQQMQQELQQAKYQLDIGASKQQADLAKAQLQAQVDLQTSEQSNQTKVIVKLMEERFAEVREEMRQMHESQENRQKEAHEVEQAVVDAELDFKKTEIPPAADDRIS